MAQQFTPVGWLIDDDTEHARMLLGSDWQRDKMGMSNMLVVTLLDAQNSVALAVAAERERWADKVMLKNLALMACASLLERVEIADGGAYGDLPETAAGVAEALRA